MTCWATTAPRERSLESPSFHYAHKIAEQTVFIVQNKEDEQLGTNKEQDTQHGACRRWCRTRSTRPLREHEHASECCYVFLSAFKNRSRPALDDVRKANACNPESLGWRNAVVGKRFTVATPYARRANQASSSRNGRGGRKARPKRGGATARQRSQGGR